jgi:carbamate kinase
VAAVIDKDHTAALLADLIGATDLLFLTSVPFASLDHGTARARPIRQASVAEVEQALAGGHFAPGSMGPKIEAAIRFVRGAPARRAIIAEPAATLEALAGQAGTLITR